MQNYKITPFGYLLIATFFILLSYAGWLYTKSIDWEVLDRLEDAPLTIPAGNITIPSDPNSTPSATPTTKK